VRVFGVFSISFQLRAESVPAPRIFFSVWIAKTAVHAQVQQR